MNGSAATVAGYCMDVTEVTVNAYAACVSAGSCSEPDTGSPCNWKVSGRENHPINCVDWNQATSYCGWKGKRLPTEEEWEWAARGGSRGTTYPWGNGEPGGQLCWDGEGNSEGKGNRHSTCPVGSFSSGDSPQGIKDLAGNVWEWTSSSDGANRAGRGGGWGNTNSASVRATYRLFDAPSFRGGYLGARCARTP